MANDNHKAYTKGSDFPPLKPGIVRLYCHRFCPFSQRTRLVAVHKQIPHEVINVHLKNKPEWFEAKAPLGCTPVVENDGKVVFDSAICNDYLDESFPASKLYPGDAYAKAQQRMLMERFNKVVGGAFALNLAENEQAKKEALQKIHDGLQPFEETIAGKFFGGDNIAMIDLHMWPFFERFAAAELIHAGVTVLPAERFPKLSTWVAAMRETEAVKLTQRSAQLHLEYLSSYKSATGIPNYDTGLD